MKTALLYSSFLIATALYARNGFASDAPLIPIADVVLADQRLAACLSDEAAKRAYTVVSDVHTLVCPARKIKSIEGLAAFTALRKINLARNAIVDWSPLKALAPQFDSLDVTANPLSCQEMRELRQLMKEGALYGFDPIACKKSDPLPPIGGPNYEKVAPIIATACGGCHQNGGMADGVALNTEREVRREAHDMLEEIIEGKMPPNNPGWKNSAEGRELIRFLKSVPHEEEESDHD